MGTNINGIEKKLYYLERVRRDMANKLDRSYLQNNISDLLALEEKYEKITHRISRIRILLSTRNRASNNYIN